MTRTAITKLTICGALALGLVAAPFQAHGSEEGRRNTAIALGAATTYFILKKKPTEALVGAAATGVAVKALQDDINARHRREREAAFNAGKRSATTSTRTASNTGTRAASAGNTQRATVTRTAAPIAPAVNTQELVSSAYRKGMDEGYRQGFEKGLQEGYKNGYAEARATAFQQTRANNLNKSNTYERIRLARL